MRLSVVLVLMTALVASNGRADETLGKLRFEQGVAAAEEKRWQKAAELLEASLKEGQRPATLFNLVLVHHELSHPLEVVRYALSFLSYPDREAHAEAKARTRALLALARAELAVITTHSLPLGSTLAINGAPPQLRHEQQLYVLPGLHHLEARFGNGLVESIELHVDAGQTVIWPRHAHASHTPVPEASPHVVPPEPEPLAPPPVNPMVKLRTRLAWSSGVLGAALTTSALGCYLGTEHRADRLAARDPTESGFVTASDEYLVIRNTVLPLAFSGGVLMAGAVALGVRSSRPVPLAWSLSSLAAGSTLLGLGSALMVREPQLVSGTSVDRPSLQAGSLLVSAALPLLTHAIITLARRQTRPSHTTALLPLGMTW